MTDSGMTDSEKPVETVVEPGFTIATVEHGVKNETIEQGVKIESVQLKQAPKLTADHSDAGIVTR